VAELENPNSSGVPETPFADGEATLDELDSLNAKLNNPDYKGAFHDKKGCTKKSQTNSKKKEKEEKKARQ